MQNWEREKLLSWSETDQIIKTAKSSMVGQAEVKGRKVKLQKTIKLFTSLDHLQPYCFIHVLGTRMCTSGDDWNINNCSNEQFS